MSSNNVTATTTPTHTALAYKLDYKRRELILNIYYILPIPTSSAVQVICWCYFFYLLQKRVKKQIALYISCHARVYINRKV